MQTAGLHGQTSNWGNYGVVKWEKILSAQKHNQSDRHSAFP